ncbi:proton channel OtopLc-like isoform X3 [Anneissia japonica]|uniref:proton channel OtopLc-like isoform X3 n=1 Tax=Anneissia japonica TaxID=1529436 RepID=UPI001425A464|nr:proton channel OtopLc-like isoform X3 [Anneissia japonica]
MSSYGTFYNSARLNMDVGDVNECFLASRQLSAVYGTGLILILSPIVMAVIRELDIDFAYNFITIMSIIALVFMFLTFSMEVYFWRIHGEHIFQEVRNNTVSTYLKVGTLLFGCVTVIFLVISIIRGLQCTGNGLAQYYMHLSEMCVCLTEIIYLYMYSQVCFQKFTILNRFGTMHLIATNMAYCIGTFLNEAFLDYCTKCGLTVCPLCAKIIITDRGYSIVHEIYSKSSPYLSACLVEYCVIASCLLRITWCNVGHRNQYQHVGIPPQHSYQIRKSKYGIITGFLTVVAIFAFGIVQHYYHKAVHNIFLYIRIGLDTSICACLFVCLWCIDVDADTFFSETISSTQDSVLLLCSMSFLVLQCLYTLAAAIVKGCILLALDTTLCLAMSIMQALFVISKKSCLRIYSKPGRMHNLLLFLTIANLSYWILSHYELKNELDLTKPQEAVYGERAWYAIHHVTGPLIILFFFHSSVCLFEIWTTLPLDGSNRPTDQQSSSNSIIQ